MKNITNLTFYEKSALIRKGNADYLDILVKDENAGVRKAVAEIGRPQDLDILVKDEDAGVRVAVARHGRDKDLDILVKDKNKDVRWVVANQGRDKDLDILVNDCNWEVRKAVAEIGRPQDLDIFANDEDERIRLRDKKVNVFMGSDWEEVDINFLYGIDDIENIDYCFDYSHHIDVHYKNGDIVVYQNIFGTWGDPVIVR